MCLRLNRPQTEKGLFSLFINNLLFNNRDLPVIIVNETNALN